jgi:hypothetical protein
MRHLAWLAVLAAACGTGPVDPTAVQTYKFGPFSLPPSTEIADQCVQISLDNDAPLYINRVALDTGPGFHHSNWFFVPAGNPATGALATFPGPDGTFTCRDRSFDQAVAAIRGGVLFAQSTQASHDVQQFPPGVAIEIPAHAKLVATIHLLNPTDGALELEPELQLTPIAKADVTTQLAGVSFENHALGLPPQQRSAFSQTCDLDPEWQILRDQGSVEAPHPDFKLYYVLAHYHALGTGMTIEAVKPDGTATTVFSTVAQIGDSLGEALDPPFDMTGYTQLRYTCDYYNSTAATVRWGIGDQEMCVFLAFSDSSYAWGGGETVDSPPGDPTDEGGVKTYTHPCMVFANDATR